jgi:hypothetical protein
MKNFVFIFAAFFICIVAGDTLHAQISRTLSYQGVLTDNAGKPRPDGSYSFTFRFYTSPTGGTAIWSESKSLPVKSGLFSTCWASKPHLARRPNLINNIGWAFRLAVSRSFLRALR